MRSGDTVPAVAQADLDAFARHHDDVPVVSPIRLIGALSMLRGSDDPAVTFARLATACVPGFADACQVELGDGAQPLFRVSFPDSRGDGPGRAHAESPASPHQPLLTPFQVGSRTGYPCYGGVVTHWWVSRAPADSDAVIADLMVKHAIALVDRERVLAELGRAEDRAASLALEAISGRAISLATGIVMHQQGLPADEAEGVLRQAAASTGTGLLVLAASVVRFGSLPGPVTNHRPPGDGRPRR
jgi:ANTAR domain